ncbi:MAG: hypothetical protein KZQ80_02520 [Candidatus Thiodiazotropha sp. (ex Monitilora ramsayi)]|nr:hypothetical protein [Candidatus Thiodiazotropha sp. (ex Monitilora ramsayi)]
MEPEQRERYVRWQNYRINQLTFSINLFLGFAVASLAYVINIKLNEKPGTINPDLLFPIYWWSASAVLGTVASLSRLLDFRYTARKIKDSSECDKKTAKFFGKATWVTFWMQVITYIVGGYVFITNVVFP